MIDVQALKERHRLEEVIEREGISLRKEGAHLVARCPFHASDKTPSFTVYTRTSSYFCFACEAWGDVIDFVRRLHHLTFREAVAYLEGQPVSRTLRQAADFTPEVQITEAHLEVLEKAVGHYQRGLEGHPQALHYLLGRALTEESIRVERVGYCGHRRLSGILRPWERTLARELGLLNGRGNDRMWKRLTFPVFKGGRAVWLIGRGLDDSSPKYLGLPIPKPLMGEDSLEGSEEAWVVEGVLDLLLLRQTGRELGRSIPAVALLGTHPTRQVAGVLKDRARVYLCLDSDEAGQRVMEVLLADLGERAVVVKLPPGAKDIGDLPPEQVKDLVLGGYLISKERSVL